MEVKPGDKIVVKINGVEIETVIDERGVQRLPRNKVIDFMMDCHFHNYNWLAEEVYKGRFSQEERRMIYQNVGYSLCGYMDVFTEDEVENPLWDEE